MIKFPTAKIKTIFRFKKRKNKDAIRPVHDWHVIILMFSIVTLGLLAVSGFIYIKINSGEIFLVKNTQTVESVAIDQNSLTTIIKTFQAKQLRFDDFKNNRTKLVDPSI